MPVSAKSVDYVVIDTGYTSRLWSEVDENGFAKPEHDEFYFEMNELLFRHNKDSGDIGEHDDEYGTIYNIKTKKPLIEPLFAYNKGCGSGLYKKYHRPEVDDVIRVLKEAKLYESGIMCFKCSGKDIDDLLTIVKKGYYCNIFMIFEYKVITSSDMGILYVHFDTESG